MIHIGFTNSFVCLLLAGTMLSTSTQAQDKTFNLEEATIAEIQNAISSGSVTGKAIVQLYLERIAAYDKAGPKLNSIITVNPKAAEEAAALDLERAQKGPRGPLHGIPVLLKDNVDTFDMATTNGSAILKNAIPPKDAIITKALRDAGAVILGKAAMGEFAGGSYNSVTGQTINPFHLKRNTGGSSAGSGAAISANFAVLAIGTDTSTSVRGPSSYTGIVGLRPTTGLISRSGIAPKNLNFDSAGPMARTVTDVTLMLNVVATRDPTDPLNAKTWEEMDKRDPSLKSGVDFTKALDRGAIKGKKFGIPLDLYQGDPEIVALAQKALDDIRRLGGETVDIKFDPEFIENHLRGGVTKMRELSDYRFREDWEKYLATFTSPDVPKTVADFVRIYEDVVMKSPLPVEDSVMRLLKTSMTRSTSAPEYIEFLEKLMPKWTAEKMAVFEKYGIDALVFPYIPTFASPIENPAYKIEDPTFVKSSAPVPATMSGYSSVGFPSIVVPMGYGSQGLPMTITFFGKPYEDAKVIGFAYAYEQATNHRKPSPIVPALPGETIKMKSK